MPVSTSLMNATMSTIFSPNDILFLWEDASGSFGVYANKKPLLKGTDWLYSTVDGVLETIKFTKTCYAARNRLV
jgi:hypothetical protein